MSSSVLTQPVVTDPQDNTTPLYMAVIREHTDIALALIDARADVNVECAPGDGAEVCFSLYPLIMMKEAALFRRGRPLNSVLGDRCVDAGEPGMGPSVTEHATTIVCQLPLQNFVLPCP